MSSSRESGRVHVCVCPIRIHLAVMSDCSGGKHGSSHGPDGSEGIKEKRRSSPSDSEIIKAEECAGESAAISKVSFRP